MKHIPTLVTGRRRLKYSIIVALLISSICAHAQDLNIDTCYALARQNYPAIKQFELIEKSKEFTISNANRNYLPQISLTGIAGYVNVFPSGGDNSFEDNIKFIGVGQLNQTIWDGGATKVQKDIAKANAVTEHANLEVTLYELRERINQVYFGILLLDAQQRQLDTLLQNLNRAHNNAKLSMENGLAYQSDVDEVRAELLKVEQNLISIHYARAGYLIMLAHLIGRPLQENVQLQTPAFTEPAAAYVFRRPELELFSSQQKLIESQADMNRAMNMPKVGLLGFAAWIEPEAGIGPASFNNILVAGLSLSWNTNNLFKTSNNRELDKIKIEKINNQLEVFNFNNSLQLKQTNSEIEKQQAIVSKDHQIIALKEKITKAYQLKYDNGVASINDLIDSLSNENEARNNLSLHQVQLLLAQYNYKTSSGN